MQIVRIHTIGGINAVGGLALRRLFALTRSPKPLQARQAKQERDRGIEGHLRSRRAERLDIVADLDEPPADRAKHFIGDRLRPHSHRVVVRISVGRQESITWIADRPFEVLSIVKHRGPNAPQRRGSPANPFYRDFPDRAVKAPGRNRWWCLGSGPAKPTAVGQQYKVSVKIDHRPVDPDLVCAP